MRKIYVSVGIDFNEVVAISSLYSSDITIPVISDSDTIDFSKMEGYVVYNGEDGQNHLKFDAEKYKAFEAEKKKQEEIKKGRMLFKQLTEESVLATASDEDALVMKYLYDDWAVGIKYKVDDRVLYEDELYRVVQAHTSQADWLPDVTKSLYVNIADPAIEYPEFIQPAGSHDAYKKDDKVTYKGKKYISTIDNNAWAPDAYPQGWKEVV